MPRSFGLPDSVYSKYGCTLPAPQSRRGTLPHLGNGRQAQIQHNAAGCRIYFPICRSTAGHLPVLRSEQTKRPQLRVEVLAVEAELARRR